MKPNDNSTAYIDGWLAHKNGCDINVNPYNEVSQEKSHSDWVCGWCARFNAIKHELDMTLDDNWEEQ